MHADERGSHKELQ